MLDKPSHMRRVKTIRDSEKKDKGMLHNGFARVKCKDKGHG